MTGHIDELKCLACDKKVDIDKNLEYQTIPWNESEKGLSIYK